MHSPPSNKSPLPDGAASARARRTRRPASLRAASLTLCMAALWAPSCGSDPAAAPPTDDQSLQPSELDLRNSRVETLEQLRARIPQGLRAPLERSIDKTIADYKATWSQTHSESEGTALSQVFKRNRLLTTILDQLPTVLEAERDLNSLLASPWATTRDWLPAKLVAKFRANKKQALAALEAMRLADAADQFAASVSNAESALSQLASLQTMSLQQDSIEQTILELQHLGLTPRDEVRFLFCSSSLIDSLIERPESITETLSLARARSSSCLAILTRSLESAQRLRALESIKPLDAHLHALLESTADSWKSLIVRSIDSACDPASDPTAASPQFLKEQMDLAPLWTGLWSAMDNQSIQLATARAFITELEAAVGPLSDLAARAEQTESHAWLYPEGWSVSEFSGRDEHRLATEITAPEIDVTFVLVGVVPADRFHMKAASPTAVDSLRLAVYLAKYPVTVAVWQQHLGRTGGQATQHCHTALTLAPSKPSNGSAETWVIDPKATFLDPLPQLEFRAGADTPATLICWDSAHAFCTEYGFELPTTSLWLAGFRSATSVVEANAPRLPDRPLARFTYLAPVSMEQPEGPGLKGMGTNVREWCAPDAEAGPTGHLPTQRPLMGGSWRLPAENPDLPQSSLARGDFAGPTVGFRPALLVPLERLEHPKLPAFEVPR